MTAWQYFAGAGLVAALCPLHGHVAVAGDGHGRGARVDLCVPGGRPGRPVAPPSAGPGVRVAVPGLGGPTVRHPGRLPEPERSTAPPPVPADPPAAVEAAGPPAAPPPPPRVPEERGPVPAGAPAPPRPRAAAARVSAFHVRPYRAVALERRTPGGMSTVTLMVVVTTPAVLAAAALRPRSKGRG
ncbi:hypothetical protein AW27_005205 [Streptomyces sp. PCS3-D2]|uniref:hypothetical protein n=1 Tax=Streptomyces sp. PCS3-D2 TaxID=1460244 RepID=UPI00272A9192|nr:hypothetical protein [Streptomyces sp. PCS3-D2]WKV76500.1 hypothetical protein AW27_005205 [Streptomyces sp. PCS3-D2]